MPNHMIDIFGVENIEAEYDKERNAVILHCYLPEVPTADSTGTIYAHLTEGVGHRYFQMLLDPSQLTKVVPDEPEEVAADSAVEVPVTVTKEKAKPATKLEGE